MPRFERRGFKSRRFGPRVDIPKPVKVGEEYDVEINEVGSRGDGIARVKNFVVFVANTKKGEKAHVKITEVRNRFAIGEKTSGEKASAVEEFEEKAEEDVEEAPEEEATEEEAPEEEATEEEIEEEDIEEEATTEESSTE